VAASFRQHPVRWILVALALPVLGLIIAAGIIVHALLQPERFTALLKDNLANAGLALTLSAPAEPTLFPHPAVRLEGFQLSNAGSGTPLLQARDARIVVPWRALLHGEAAIERVEVSAPHIDLGELQMLFARLPHTRGAPQLPRIEAGMRMTDGTIMRGGSPLLFDFDLDTGPLAPGRQFGLDASARTGAGKRITLALSTVPASGRDGALVFDKIALMLGQQGGARLRLDGQATWHGGADFAAQLRGTLTHPMLAPASTATSLPPRSSGPPAPASAASAPESSAPAISVTDAVVMDILPAQSGTPMTVALKLDGADAHVDARVQPGAFADWWKRIIGPAPGSTAPLPFTGSASVQALDLGWLQAKGLHIEAGPDLAPAATTAPPPSPSAKAAGGH